MTRRTQPLKDVGKDPRGIFPRLACVIGVIAYLDSTEICCLGLLLLPLIDHWSKIIAVFVFRLVAIRIPLRFNNDTKRQIYSRRWLVRSCGKRTASNLSLFLTGIVSAGSASRPLGRRELATCSSRFPLGPFTCPTTDWEAASFTERPPSPLSGTDAFS